MPHKNNNIEKDLNDVEMTDREFSSLVKSARSNTVAENTDYLSKNEKLLNQYLSNPYGDEVDGRSQIVTNDMSDTVESDLPSLIRIFLGTNNLVEFVPLSSKPEDIQEAHEKSEYINYIIKNQEDKFKIIHDWIKSALIQKCAVIKYFADKKTCVEEHTFEGIDENELVAIEESLDGEDVKSIEIVSKVVEEQSIQDGVKETIIQSIISQSAQAGQKRDAKSILPAEIDEAIANVEASGAQIRTLPKYDLTFRVVRETQRIKIIGIPTEDFIISEDAQSKHDAEVVGDKVSKTRGQLLSEGFDRDLIDKIPSFGSESESSNNRTQLQRVRAKASTGSSNSTDSSSINDWASEEVEIYDLYMNIDYDGDGIAERRHILMAGNEILVNEVFNHVPYAILSSILMPYTAIGRSRAELVQVTQRVKTVLTRQMLDNTYMSNMPRLAINENVDIDDALDVRPNGIIRVEGDNPINNDIIPVSTPFTGDKTLLTIQYLDASRANSTGNFIANQGLSADAVSKETATRFDGVKASGEAKVELVARVFAETGFRDLFEGLAWMVTRYQDEETEIRVLGKQLTVSPKSWKYNHRTEPKIVNEEKMMESLMGLYQIQKQEKAEGSPLVDHSKIFETLNLIMRGMGIADTSKAFNNPAQPDEMIVAQNEQLTQQVQQLTQMLEQAQNPLAEAEEIKAQTELVKAQAKQQIDIAKLEEDQRQFNIKTQQDNQKWMAEFQQEQKEQSEKMIELFTRLELQYNKNIEGSKV